MAEKQLALDQVNAEIVRELLRDLVIECTSSTQVVIKQDSRAGSDDGQAILHAAADLTVDITTSGKNGLDTGAEASDTWYYIWMIYNPGTQETAGLLSASASSPTLPSGFTKKRLVGAVRNNGSSDFRSFFQRNGNVTHAYITLVANANNTSFLEYDLTSLIPPGLCESVSYLFQARDTLTTASPLCFLSLDGVNSCHLNLPIFASTDRANARMYQSVVLTNKSSDSIWGQAALSTDDYSILVQGFTLDL